MTAPPPVAVAAPEAAPGSAPPVSTASPPGLRVQTLGGFRVWRGDGVEIDPAAWGRDKALQLFQFMITLGRRRLTREQIIDRLWPESTGGSGDSDFKVALNAVQRAIEPDRPPRAEPRFVRRFGAAYGLDTDTVWIDAVAMEAHIAAASAAWPADPAAAIHHLRAATDLYTGDFLPERRYEDWASFETERLQTLALSAMTRLADLVLADNPLESIHLTQRVLAFDPVWEDAWRIQMRAHLAAGNRALALRAWQSCEAILRRELDLAPLPATRAVFESIRGDAQAAAPSRPVARSQVEVEGATP